MRGYFWRAAAVLALGLAAVFVSAFSAGCRSTTHSGMPDHIKTVEVHLFQNKTMYGGIEGNVTRRLVDRVNGDPRVRLVSNGGDAVITGEILSVSRHTLRETTTDEPGTVQFVITASYSLYDETGRRYLIEDATVSSNVAGLLAGLYETSHATSGDISKETAAAASAVADEIARRTIGMW